MQHQYPYTSKYINIYVAYITSTIAAVVIPPFNKVFHCPAIDTLPNAVLFGHHATSSRFRGLCTKPPGEGELFVHASPLLLCLCLHCSRTISSKHRPSDFTLWIAASLKGFFVHLCPIPSSTHSTLLSFSFLVPSLHVLPTGTEKLTNRFIFFIDKSMCSHSRGSTFFAFFPLAFLGHISFACVSFFVYSFPKAPWNFFYSLPEDFFLLSNCRLLNVIEVP